jgi:hypothetical protein
MKPGTIIRRAARAAEERLRRRQDMVARLAETVARHRAKGDHAAAALFTEMLIVAATASGATVRVGDHDPEPRYNERDCHVVDEENHLATLGSFTSVAECEEHIAKLEVLDPDKVHRGGFGIDAPEHKTNPNRRA